MFGRTLFILGSDSPIVDELLDNRGTESVVPGALLSMIGSLVFCAGYLVARESHLKLRTLDNWFDLFHEKRFMVFAPILFVICAAGIIYFLRQTGFQFTGISSLSQKRRVIINDVESSLGYVRLVAQDLARMVLLFLTAIWCVGGRKTLGLIGCLAGFAVLSIALPFLASSRTNVVFALIAVCVVINLLREIRVTSLVLVGTLAVGIIFGMLGLRRISRGTDAGQAFTELGLEPLFGNHNFADVVKLGHVYDAVPDLIDYKYGASYVSIVYAPIPRSIWKEKPPIGLGREISEKIYNKGLQLKDKGGGTPPGLYAESLINFSIYGFPIAVFVAGALLRLLHNSLARLAETSVPGVVLYAAVIPTYCLSMMGGDFTRSLVQGLSALVLVIALCFLARLKIIR